MPQRELTTYQAVIAQARAFRALKTHMATILSSHNLTMTEWLMIGSVIDCGTRGARVSEIAAMLGVELPVITNLVHKARKAGWVVSVADPDDKRSKRIVATEFAVDKAQGIECELREGTKKWISGLDRGQLTGYFAVVRALAEKYNKSY